MLKKTYKTERLILVQSEAPMAAQVVDFYERNREFFRDTEPLHEKTFFSEDFQRRALARDLKSARELRALRLWMLPAHEPDGKIAGMLGLGSIIFGPFRSAFLSYKLDSEKTGKGLMEEALRKLIAIAFDDIGLHRLEANIMPRNLPSLRLVERLGFSNEGLAKKYLNIGGVWEDHIHMVLLNERDEEKHRLKPRHAGQSA